MEKEVKKYYATQVDLEDFIMEDYINLYCEDCESVGIWFGGRRDYKEINEDLLKDIKNNIDDCEYEIKLINDNELLSEEDKETQKSEKLNYYFKKIDNSELTNEEKEKLIQLMNEYLYGAPNQSYATITNILSIVKCEEYMIFTAKGYSQDEWLYCMCPVRLKNYAQDVEDILFSKVKIFAVTDTKVTKEEVEKAENIFCSEYIVSDRVRDYKKDLSRQLSVEEDEIVIRMIKKIEMVKHYVYSEE